MNRRVTVGIIGAGRIGRVHAVSLAGQVPGARLVMVADVYAQAAAALGDEFNIPHTTDPHELLARDDVDAVAICSSTDTHAELIGAAAEAGKHIFCEKPIALDLETIDGALAAVERAGVKLMVGFNRRFDANFARVRELVAGGAIGEPHVLRITSRDPEPPPLTYIERSGGLFLDMMIHDFDMARFLLGSEVVSLHATGAVLVDPQIGAAGDVDTAVVTLVFANGALGTIDNSRRAAYGYDQRVEVFGSRGMTTVGNETPNSHTLYTEEGVSADKPLYFFLERYRDAYVAEMKAFVSAVSNDTPVPVSGEDGRIPVLLGRAAQRSLAEGRPVRIDEMQDGV